MYNVPILYILLCPNTIYERHTLFPTLLIISVADDDDGHHYNIIIVAGRYT